MSNPSVDSAMRMVKWAVVAFGLFTVVLSIVFFGWWTMKDRFVFGDAPFDPVRWMAAATVHDSCDRGDMVLDVQKRVLHRGMSRNQVSALLGRPAWEEENQYEYELGVCLWVVHGLRVYFDNQGRLIHSAIIQH